ncbi:hypothetical protein EW145_g1091 [Phellinidium pouzarii]|uniref:SUI1 domain-containing protein n=1 Tax=Phellinidium pouzarii TaxID=167371 RepID=A0A4S4LHN2_9AGAM|nr:hypothetical protein EW145_g1091 [Phellinidium pouzarii]
MSEVDLITDPTSAVEPQSPASETKLRSPPASASSVELQSPASSVKLQSPTSSVKHRSPTSSVKHRSPPTSASSVELQSPASSTELRSPPASASVEGKPPVEVKRKSPASGEAKRKPPVASEVDLKPQFGVSDPFDDDDDDEANLLGGADEVGSQRELIHIRIQQRNGRKTLTTLQGLNKKYDLKKLLKAFKKEFACNGTLIDDAESGQIIQLQGDQRSKIQNFLTDEGVSKLTIKVHGF